MRKAVQYGIAGITDVKLRKALSNVYQGAMQLMTEQEFWEGLLAMYMYCSPDSNYNGYFKGYSNILICSENYFFYIVERAIGRRWTYEDNHFFVELKNDFTEILGIVQGDLSEERTKGKYMEKEYIDRMYGFFDDIEALGFPGGYGRGLLIKIDVWDEGNCGNLTADEILIVSTIYGEADASSEASWAAIAHIIMNRVGMREWSGLTTPVAIIKNSGFDSYITPNAPYREAERY